MLCEECGQNPASVVITVLVNGETATRHLCKGCVSKIQNSIQQGDIQSFLSSLMSSISQAEKTPQLTCSKCHLTYEEFQKTGKLGCAHCYEDFREQLKPLLLRIHGRSQHAGRMPMLNAQAQEKKKMIASLRSRMDQAVSAENFEEAAVLRDQLRQLACAAGEECKS
jgi:protein arginine kinase activator